MLNKDSTNAIQKMNVVSKYKLIGSDSYKGLLYTSDIDLQGDLKGNTETKILNYFKKIVKSNDEFLIMDLKCGLDTRLVYKEEDDLKTYLSNPLIDKATRDKIEKATGETKVKLIRDLFVLRWTIDDIQNGKVKLIDGTYKLFVDCLKDDTMIKLDIAVPHNGTFIDINEVYSYKSRPVSQKQLVLDLEEDIDLYHHNNTLKSLKRLYSLLLLTKKKKKLQKQLEDLFNSTIGYSNKLMNDIVFFLKVCDKHYIPWETIQNNIDIFKDKYFKLESSKNTFVSRLNKATVKNYKKILTELAEVLRVNINRETKEEFKKMK